MLQAARRVAEVGHQDVVDAPLHEEQLLRLVEPHHHDGCECGKRTGLVNDADDAVGERYRAEEDLEAVAGPRVQPFGAEPTQVHLTLPQLQPGLAQHPVDLATERAQIQVGQGEGAGEARLVTERWCPAGWRRPSQTATSRHR